MFGLRSNRRALAHWVSCVGQYPFNSVAAHTLAHKAIKVFNVELPAWRVIGFELMVPWRKIRSYFKYLKTDKYEFTSHKL